MDVNFESEGGVCAIDDFFLEPKSCPKFPGSCNFDEGLCGYTDYIIKDVSWLVGRGFTRNPDIVNGGYSF